MKERILNETTSLTKIYDEEVKKACLSAEEIALLPTVVEFRSNMSKARKKCTPVIPKTCVFDIPPTYQETVSGNRFLLMDYYLKRAKERVLVFASDAQLDLLFESDVIFVDGTFSTAPGIFDQVFIIHVQQFNQGLPVVFCLMPNRRTTTYAELFRRLKEEAIRNNKTFKPKRVVSDFELALVAAVRTEFPDSLHSGCNFHFLQAVHRNIGNLGLASEYKENETIREQCRQLMALSLMPPSEVEKQFKRIRMISSESLEDLFIYFQRQWINGSIPLSLWNANEYDDRTNNVSEAFNRRFGSRIAKKHPNIWTFIRLIQDEEVRFQRVFIQLASGATNTKQSTTKTAFQRRFEVLNIRFKNGEINSKQLLAGLTSLIGGQKK
ncbi:unnamed protein product [Adineta steineri]|uniref:MULE transposase domain-containing protein n=1 Tax=Adineta steineri TaxID=433720 RepID=A0A815RSN4_9BILA|nr:unnamed protein product [Adineta steineri]CAF1481028.1 unnamed protein product [Adineta steineri]CAF3688355.1 unnamed protein product [Adineta steineri]